MAEFHIVEDYERLVAQLIERWRNIRSTRQ
jgi:hypothetical protein